MAFINNSFRFKKTKPSNDWFVKNIKVHRILSIADIDNRWIIGDVKCVVNVSSDPNSEVCRVLQAKNINCYWFPMTECNSDMGLHSIFGALQILRGYIELRESCIIHCYGGNNRSRVVYESLYYLYFSNWPTPIEDTKVFENSQKGHLPSIDKYIKFLTDMKDNRNIENCFEGCY